MLGYPSVPQRVLPGGSSRVEVKTSGLGLGPPPTSPSDHFYEVECVQDFC